MVASEELPEVPRKYRHHPLSIMLNWQHPEGPRDRFQDMRAAILIRRGLEGFMHESITSVINS